MPTAPSDSEMHEDIHQSSTAPLTPRNRTQNERNADGIVVNDPTGRVGRKRSLEDLGDAENGGTSNAPKHIRKRSRELEEDSGRHSPKDQTHPEDNRVAQKTTYTKAAPEDTDVASQTEAGSSSGKESTGIIGQKTPTKVRVLRTSQIPRGQANTMPRFQLQAVSPTPRRTRLSRVSLANQPIPKLLVALQPQASQVSPLLLNRLLADLVHPARTRTLPPTIAMGSLQLLLANNLRSFRSLRAAEVALNHPRLDLVA